MRKYALALGAMLALIVAGCGSTERVTTVRETVKTVTQTVTAQAHTDTPASASATAVPAPPPVATLTDFGAEFFEARVPADWTQEADDEAKSGYRESRWRDPTNSDTSILIDAAPNESLSA